jgi:hypothetical protein
VLVWTSKSDRSESDAHWQLGWLAQADTKPAPAASVLTRRLGQVAGPSRGTGPESLRSGPGAIQVPVKSSSQVGSGSTSSTVARAGASSRQGSSGLSLESRDSEVRLAIAAASLGAWARGTSSLLPVGPAPCPCTVPEGRSSCLAECSRLPVKGGRVPFGGGSISKIASSGSLTTRDGVSGGHMPVAVTTVLLFLRFKLGHSGIGPGCQWPPGAHR